MSFGNYPKQRPELPEAYKKIYTSWYRINRNGESQATSLSQKMEQWLHRKVAQDVRHNDSLKTLEIGAGTLNQLMYESTRQYDIVEPFQELYESSPFKSRIGRIYTDISLISDEQKYDRIIAIACFEHICNLPDVVAKSKK